MADQDTDEPGTAPSECRPCSGKGKVISNLGGSPSEIVCPWCEGTGRFIADHDAQERWAMDASTQESAPSAQHSSS